MFQARFGDPPAQFGNLRLQPSDFTAHGGIGLFQCGQLGRSDQALIRQVAATDKFSGQNGLFIPLGIQLRLDPDDLGFGLGHLFGQKLPFGFDGEEMVVQLALLTGKQGIQLGRGRVDQQRMQIHVLPPLQSRFKPGNIDQGFEQRAFGHGQV